MASRLAAGVTAAMASMVVAAYLVGWVGAAVAPWPCLALGLAVGAVSANRGHAPDHVPVWVWLVLVGGVLALLLRPAWPALVPPGGASDLTHHLMLVDVLERTRHLVDGAGAEAAMGEMAHYTPGLHLLMVMAGALVGAEAFRTAYPLLALTVTLKAGVVFLIAYDALALTRARLPLALAAVALVLFAPRAYSLDGLLQAGFYAQVAAELFVVAGWWGLARWWASPSPPWLAFVGLMGAAVFLVWPIWIGPLILTAGLAVVFAPRVPWASRTLGIVLAVGPTAGVATLHLVQHAGWLRMAGTSGAVPAFVPGGPGWLLLLLGAVGIVAALTRGSARVTVSFALAVVLQGLALWLLARARGAETPYMAMKMIYVAVFPVAVLAVVGLGALIERARWPGGVAWALAILVLAVDVRAVAATSWPPPLVDVDLDRVGRWARANVPAGCVDYIVDNAEQAYWLHLAVMGQPRSSPRTADIDGYTANRAVGRWIEGAALPYAVARRSLLAGEVLADADIVYEAGSAVVIHRRGGACPLVIGD